MISFSTNSKILKLTNFDISGNQFSGSLPDALFLISSLDSIALSVNCFQGKLPKSICEAVNCSVMSLDGLRSAKECHKQSMSIPFTKVSLGNMMDGSISDCIWRLSNLETLNLGGNGLKGSLPNKAMMTKLEILTLSHNYLSGTIPIWLLEKSNLKVLDLSNNKFTGDLDGLRMRNITHHILTDTGTGSSGKSTSSNKELKLRVNRLSGQLPSSLNKIYQTLDILSGNMFGCDSNIPNNDEGYDGYVCGSSEYDQSLMGMGVITSLILLFFLIYLLSVTIVITTSHHNKSTRSSNTATAAGRFLFSLRKWGEESLRNYDQLLRYIILLSCVITGDRSLPHVILTLDKKNSN
jgi:hypothetical protein